MLSEKGNKRLQILIFLLYEISRMGKFIERDVKQISGGQGLWEKSGKEIGHDYSMNMKFGEWWWKVLEVKHGHYYTTL